MKLLYTLIIIILPSILLAQSNYQAAYVLKNNGDTLKGYINFREWAQTPKTIEFKVNKSDMDAKWFSPTTIKGFKINNEETYTAYKGVISMNRTDFDNTPTGLDTSKKLDTIFLKQIATGSSIRLLHNNDETKTRFFIAETNGAPVELKYYTYYNDYKQVADLAIYKGQLLVYANKFKPGNDRLSIKINELRYDQAHLEAVVNQINNNSTVVVKKSSSRIFAGVSVNSTNTQVDNVYSFDNVNNYSSLSPKISFGADLFGNPYVQRVIFRTELSFSYITPKFKYPVIVSNASTNEVYEFNQYTAAVTPQVIYNIYNTADFKIYIDAGLQLNVATYSNNKLTIESSDTNVVMANTVSEPYKLNSFWTSFPLQAGVMFNKNTEISVTYNGYATYNGYPLFYAKSKSINLGVRFYLGKQ